MEELRIRNWDKWQTYRKDRGQPPWIKLHREVMRNPDWVALTDAQRGQLVAIWLLAADHNGVIPASPCLIKKLCFLDSEPDLQVYIDHGFIEPDASVTPHGSQDDANMTNQSREEAEKSREEKRRKTSLSQKFTEQDMEIARNILEGVQRIVPDAKKPNMDSWANTVRLMRERDKRAAKKILDTFQWANSDTFWQGNILSPNALRKNFDKLRAKMNGQADSTGYKMPYVPGLV